MLFPHVAGACVGAAAAAQPAVIAAGVAHIARLRRPAAAGAPRLILLGEPWRETLENLQCRWCAALCSGRY